MLLCGSLTGSQRDSEATRVARLAATGRLWATIKYFHPGLSESRPEAWDAALLETIPRVQAAASREEYASALRRMIGRLEYPVTRIAQDRPQPPTPRYGFASIERRSEALLVTSGAVDGDPLQTADRLREQLAHVDAVVFDLRPGAVHPWLWDPRSLSADPLPHPSHRFRLHVGHVPIRGAQGAPFFSGVVTRTAPTSAAATGVTRKRVVFLVRDGEELPLLASALQDAGHGWIVAERPIDDRAFARHGYARR